MVILRLVLSAAVLVATAPAVPAFAAGANQATVCPAINKTSAGSAGLRTVDIYDGPVADNATLAPDSSDEGAGSLTNRWSFDASQSITVICGYGLTKQVHALSKATACTARFKVVKTAEHWRPTNVVCG